MSDGNGGGDVSGVAWGGRGDSGPVLGVRRAGQRALLVDVSDAASAMRLAGWLRTQELACTDVVPAARTVLVDGVDVSELGALLRAWDGGDLGEVADEGIAVRRVEVPVRYDGPDLRTVAARWDVHPDEVVRRHTALEFVSVFCGFAPGFAYLDGLPPEWAVPRLDTPRTRVPAGAVGLADRWCAVYPTASPGGWLLLGTTTTPVWDLGAPDGPALLRPGTRVRFVAT